MSAIDASTDCAGYRIALPLMIAPMSGGTKIRDDFNHMVASVAQHCRIPCGLGSMRVLLRHPEVESQFLIKSIARDVPLIANIGAVQLRERALLFKTISLCDRLGADILSVHLNCGQELFQEDGDRDFVGMRAAISEIVKLSPIPIMAKETGFGIAPKDVRALIDCGVKYIDVAGSGGANWINVEAYRHQETEQPYPDATLFSDWGISAAIILAALQDSSWTKGCTLIASGGIRNAMHIAKSIALGASLTSMALPFSRILMKHGVAHAIQFVEQIVTDLKTIMLLCGAKSIADLQSCNLLMSHEFTHTVSQLRLK